jgi:hypothetical protein
MKESRLPAPAAGFRRCIEHPVEGATDGYSLDAVQNLFPRLA